MNRQLLKYICLLLALLMIPAAALAGRISEFLDLLTNAPGESGLEIQAQCTVSAMPEYSPERTEWLNGLLKHLTFRLITAQGGEEVSILTDGEPALGFQSRQGNEGTEYVFSFEPDIAYRTEKDTALLTSLAGSETDLSSLAYYSDLYQMMAGFYEYFAGLPDVFPDACTWSNIKVDYKGYGTAVQRCAIALPEEAFTSAEMNAYVSSLPEGPVKDLLCRLVWSGRQRYTILVDENRRPMKINYTGRAGLSAEDIRNVNVDWRCPRGENGKYKDILQLTNPNGNGSDRNNITLNQELVLTEDGSEQLTGTIETDRVVSRARTRIILKIQLESKDDQITGTFNERTVVGSNAEGNNLQIQLTKDESGEYEGTLEITGEMNKIEKNHFMIQMKASSGALSPWKAEQTILMKESDYPILSEMITRTFLKSLVSIPEKDLQFFLADLPEDFWAQFKETVDE